MHITYIFITVEKTKSLYTYNGCLSLEIVRSSDVFIKHDDGIMSLKKCTPCTSDVYVVSLMYTFEKLIILEKVCILRHESYDKYDASVM